MNQKRPMNEFPLLNPEDGVPLFYPYVPKLAKENVIDTLNGRWIGQGPKVDLFEKEFKSKFLGSHEPLAVGSGTDALHLAYLLAGVSQGDEVLVPVFTCTATNIPLLYIGAKPVFVDINSHSMNLDLEDLQRKLTSKTKALVCVDYGGIPNEYDYLVDFCKKNNLALISDAAHSLGSKFNGQHAGQFADFTIYSFQAIKTLTTGDGGLLAIKDKALVEKAKRLRWFGINRAAKQKGVWENDIVEVGYKYQMNDIAAAIGLAGLVEIDQVINYRNKLFSLYENLIKNSNVKIVGKAYDANYYNAAWLITILIDHDRFGLMKKLRDNKIESAQVHYRNDRYSIFGGRSDYCPNMDELEDKYLVLPLHVGVTFENVEKIANLINEGW